MTVERRGKSYSEQSPLRRSVQKHVMKANSISVLVSSQDFLLGFCVFLLLRGTGAKQVRGAQLLEQ